MGRTIMAHNGHQSLAKSKEEFTAGFRIVKQITGPLANTHCSRRLLGR
jgi:hypothetical protein